MNTFLLETQNFFLFSFLLGLIAVVQEHKGEHKDAEHHAEGGCVVRVGGHDEPLVLVVTQGAHGYLG